MKEIMVYICIAITVLVFFIYQSVKMRKFTTKRIRDKIMNSWGKPMNHEYAEREFENLTHYYKNYKNKNSNEFYIDDITWNDLDMDGIYKQIDHTMSSAGEEYLYKLLRTPALEKNTLDERERLFSFFENNEHTAFKFQEIFSRLGKTKKISLADFIERTNDLVKESNLFHYIMDFLLLVSIIMLFIMPIAGLAMIFGVVFVNVFTYYKKKSEIESFYICFRYLVNMINCADELNKEKLQELNKYTLKMQKCLDKLKPIKKRIFLLMSNNVSGSIGEVLMDYVRMLFHVDIIKFNNMIDCTKSNINEIYRMFEILGIIESSISVASYRKQLPYYTVPRFVNENKTICTKDIYHPMITNAVPNSINEDRSVLLTGSNASGKSTFLKTIAINSILAQTINTCSASEYIASFFMTYSSMALKDNLENSESYFIVEIKSLKRILDGINDNVSVLCFVDEVLRGTNTVERIAASSYILRQIANENAICFAATHDIELTDILNEYYSNYHFTEEVKDNDVLFNYQLNKGKATSRNAIRLLKIIGFEDDIVNNAEEMAESFINTGLWINI